MQSLCSTLELLFPAGRQHEFSVSGLQVPTLLRHSHLLLPGKEMHLLAAVSKQAQTTICILFLFIDSVAYFIFLDCLHFLAKKNDGINLLNFDLYINKETNQTKIGKS